jgi:hypothetical protein
MNPFDSLNTDTQTKSPLSNNVDTRYVIVLGSPRVGDVLIRDGANEGYPLLFSDAHTAIDYIKTTVKPYIKPDVAVWWALYTAHYETPLLLNVSQA